MERRKNARFLCLPLVRKFYFLNEKEECLSIENSRVTVHCVIRKRTGSNEYGCWEYHPLNVDGISLIRSICMCMGARTKTYVT